jgi:ligand-binding SRPBCC domain-containing protein
MPEHSLNFSLTLNVPRPTVFEFFSDAANLERLTPPELAFRLLTPLPIEMKQGAIIDYRLKMFGFPFTWKTEITAWAPPDYFIDEQRKGPYRQWIHRHTFRDGPDGGTLVEDEIRFRLPGSPLGEAAYPKVRAQLERIFQYRQEAVKVLLASQTRP